MKCPYCKKSGHIVPRGSYVRASDRKKMRRFRCLPCRRSFSEQTFRLDYRMRKRAINQLIFRALCSGISQRRCARLYGVKPIAVARRVVRFGLVAKENLARYRDSLGLQSSIMFDEMESFEHTKCKPLTIPIAIGSKSRKILSLAVGQIAAKGHLASISRKKYGFRCCQRAQVLNTVFSELSECCSSQTEFHSDESPHYPKRLRGHFPEAHHITSKGRRGCVVGQGELKAGSWDPLFNLNHTYAMVRDNLKRLSRRTWCTTKRPDILVHLLYIYACFHNQMVDGVRLPRIRAVPNAI